MFFENSTVCFFIDAICMMLLAGSGLVLGWVWLVVLCVVLFLLGFKLRLDLSLGCFCFGVVWCSVFYGEFDPGSGRTLAACLTHASRTLKLSACWGWMSGERVSNT